ncbi:hypothetical protein [Lacinutrix mariniflava]|uniref:hypothetical protein n=1 Tax=Lacinutrix mariniflava TaxID=342955 RepID=UPI0006E1E220|nr:hypothetical protein [Lacinutrix mariniflava]
MIEPKYTEGKLIEFKLKFEELTKTIKVKSYYAVKNSDSNDNYAGKIIENYRQKVRDTPESATEYYNSKIEVINSFIDKLEDKSSNKYDYVQLFLPSDENRNELLTNFSNKHFNSENDFSTSFYKKKNTSIVGLNCDDANNLFTYEEPINLNNPLKSILLIDDTIDTGCTIKIFLKKLYELNIFDKETEINAFIIYNNYKAEKMTNPMDLLRKMK